MISAKKYWNLLYTTDQFLSWDSIFEYSKIWQGFLAIYVKRVARYF